MGWKRKKAQIWVETVLYILVALALIALVLALVMPKINQRKERIIVEQSIAALSVFDAKIAEAIDRGYGNIRKVPQFKFTRGQLLINTTGDEIVFLIDDLTAPYSEPGVEIAQGPIKLKTTKRASSYLVTLRLDYHSPPIANITFQGRDDVVKKFPRTSKPYDFTILNNGTDPSNPDSLPQIDITESSSL
ncbi:hypothetical protein D6817_05170 [Candidatus Pacearchaeota archaeon]|nr:MAG: hypothetical protein D6817_05170 [Candidatus Pacearchaeota archaeon]